MKLIVRTKLERPGWSLRTTPEGLAGGGGHVEGEVEDELRIERKIGAGQPINSGGWGCQIEVLWSTSKLGASMEHQRGLGAV